MGSSSFEITIEQAWKLFENQNGKCALTGDDLTFQKNKENIIEKVKEYNKNYVKTPEQIKEYNKRAYEKKKAKKMEEPTL